ncbi:SGNH/GDSL hydrolase family protein [Massilia sp. 9096]|uniref:SGNH/GDSL hydrolase family protein n=1 Tax=Massilia sp. 9096 TaxID=1500894 RepID=UPI000A50CBB3|nr:SGNH/GDSL hydrolase family protein [Massilia sp. 9096]
MFRRRRPGAAPAQPASANRTAAAPAPSASGAAIEIDAEGDSTMSGLETVGGQFVQSAHPVPALVQAQLRSLFGVGVTVNANGSSGANLDMELNGTGNYSTPLATRPALSRARIVIENFGINDAYLPADAYRANLVRFVDVVRAGGKLPVLEEPNPVCLGHETLDALVGILNEVAREKNVPLVMQYDAIKALPGWQSMLTDCAHPDDALYAFKAAREADVLAQVIRSNGG